MKRRSTGHLGRGSPGNPAQSSYYSMHLGTHAGNKKKEPAIRLTVAKVLRDVRKYAVNEKTPCFDMWQKSQLTLL
jgi:hypothetical protein